MKLNYTSTLNFRLLRDPELSLNDRIIFSFICKWKWINEKRVKAGKRSKKLTQRRFRKATGFRSESINESIATLKRRGYVTDTLRPVKDGRYLGYRKITYSIADRGVLGLRMVVFVGVYESNTCAKRPGWWMVSLGISRATYYRMKMEYDALLKVATDETRVATNETHPAATDDTVSK